MVRNLNSALDCKQILPVTFLRPQDHEGNFDIWRVDNAYECNSILMQLCQGDLDTASDDEADDGDEELGTILVPQLPRKATSGQLYVLSGAASSANDGRAVTFMSLQVARLPECYYWTTRDPTAALDDLDERDIITLSRDVSRSASRQHGRLYMMLQLPFEQATRIPHSPEWLAAEAHSVADDIEPAVFDDALDRIQGDRYLSRQARVRSMANDRYAHHLADWEVWICKRADVCAAEYLEIKRRYILKYSGLVARHRRENDIGAGQTIDRVRNDKNLVDDLSSIRSWGWSRRRIFVEAWRVAGLLDPNDY